MSTNRTSNTTVAWAGISVPGEERGEKFKLHTCRHHSCGNGDKHSRVIEKILTIKELFYILKRASADVQYAASQRLL